jgi:antitoxin MazE
LTFGPSRRIFFVATEGIVNAKIQKWGNSLALRIPKAFANEVGVTEDTVVEVRVEGGGLRIIPAHPQRYSLADLLKQAKKSQLHEAEEFGGPVGRELL